MDRLKELLTTNADLLAKRTREQAERHGFTEPPGVTETTWKNAVEGINGAIAERLDAHGLEGFSPLPEEARGTDSASILAIQTAHQFQERGMDLATFMGLLKIYRRSYTALLEEMESDSKRQRLFRAFLARFFDRIEIALCINWVEDKKQEETANAKRRHEALVHERNRFITLFESLSNPIFMLGNGMEIEAMNREAFRLLGMGKDPGEIAYALCDSDADKAAPRVSLETALPWLAEEIHNAGALNGQRPNTRFDVSVTNDFIVNHYNVSISSLANISDAYTGHAVVLNDITFRVEMEQQLSKERNRAAYYLNVVGSMVVALDASGSVTLINKAGCDVLGYSEFELLGQNWVDMVIPPEQRDEVRDYFYHLVSDEVELEDQHINHVITSSGELRLVSWNNRLLHNEGGLPIGILAAGTDITEQRAMEDALAEKEVWLRNTFIALSESVIILTPERRVIDMNPAAEAMFQMTAEEAQNIPARTFHADDEHYARFGEILNAAFDRGEPAEFEFVLKRKDGTIFPTEHAVSLIIGDDGSPLGIVSVCRDISRRKEAEKRLKRSEEKFRRIFESIEEGYIVTDLDGVIQMINPATCNLLGYTEDELVGNNLGILYDNAEERAKFVSNIKIKGSVRGFHITAMRKDGSTIITEANAHLIVNPDGSPLGMEGTFRDITARIEAEKILREREKQYRAFFENNHAIMLLVDPKSGDIVDANPAASNFYGYSVEEMRGMPMTDIQAQPEEEIYREMFRARDENRVYFVLQHRLQSGEVRDVEVYSGPIMVQGNQFLYSVIHDVTSRILLEREMKRMATTDALTGVNNRHQFFKAAGQELKRSQRYGHALTAIMLDIDYFKSINDTHGHHAGDLVLKALADLTRNLMRETDIIGRLGGEEFAAILPETDLDSGYQVAERLRREIELLGIDAKDEIIRLTASMGVAIARDSDMAIEDVINRADEALYKAKRMGRNRVVKS